MLESFRNFKREAVGEALRTRLDAPCSVSQRIELNRLIGFFGSSADAEGLKSDACSGREELANASYEALMRLTDPLRLPEHWSVL